MKVVAPYRKFRIGHISFAEKVRECSDEEVLIIKKIPSEMGEFKDSDGKVLNQPLVKKVAKKAKKSKSKSKK